MGVRHRFFLLRFRSVFGGPTRLGAVAYTLIALAAVGACDGGGLRGPGAAEQPPRAQEPGPGRAAGSTGSGGPEDRATVGAGRSASSPAAVETVVLAATHPDGVPLHPREHDRAMSGRLPDRIAVEVVRWGEGRRWLEVRAPDGTRGWISARYVAPEGTHARAPRAPTPWDSPEACAASPVERPEGRARIASWNLRWFPDGSSHGPSEQPTDVAWMACAIASLGADAVAVQEVMLHERGRAAMDRLLGTLSARTGGRWEAHFDTCPRDGRQHVGWLVNVERVGLEGVRQLDALNPLGACAHHLRPGLAIDLRWPGGLDLRAVVVHLDSGREHHDHAHRGASFDTIGRLAADEDLIVIGDFNTMGCRECNEDADAELARLDALSASLRRVPSATPCTEYYRRRGSLLDHVVITRATRELAADARVQVAGPCARFDCALPRGRHVAALERLSDHCPIVVELLDRDAD